MRALPDVPRVWWSVDLPGIRDHPTEFTAYFAFDYEQLPPIERDLDDELLWLLEQPHEIWFNLADPESEPRPLTSEQRRYAEHYPSL